MKQSRNEAYFFIMIICLTLGLCAFVLNETSGVGQLVIEVLK